MQSFAIIPAAGHSRRMKRPKLLLPWRDSTVIEQVIAAWRRSRVNQIIMVAREEDRELVAAGRRSGAWVVPAASPPAEMKASVMLGLEFAATRFAPAPGDAWLLAPADLPGISPRIIDKLLACYSPQDPTIVAAAFQGRRGHPVLFPWRLASQIQELPAGVGINGLLQHHSVRELACDDQSILNDLDTPEDYQRLQPSSHLGPPYRANGTDA